MKSTTNLSTGVAGKSFAARIGSLALYRAQISAQVPTCHESGPLAVALLAVVATMSVMVEPPPQP